MTLYSFILYWVNCWIGSIKGDGRLVGCVLRPIDSEVIYRRQPHLLSIAMDVKLGFYTVPTGNRTPGRRVAVHYNTAAPRQLHHLRRCVVMFMLGYVIQILLFYCIVCNTHVRQETYERFLNSHHLYRFQIKCCSFNRIYE